MNLTRLEFSTTDKYSDLFSLVYKSFDRALTMSEKQQRLVYSIIEFLNQSIQEGTIKADDQEGVEVASA